MVVVLESFSWPVLMLDRVAFEFKLMAWKVRVRVCISLLDVVLLIVVLVVAWLVVAMVFERLELIVPVIVSGRFVLMVVAVGVSEGLGLQMKTSYG